MNSGPYREQPIRGRAKLRLLDPWFLALLFAWVGCIAQITRGVMEHRPIGPELGFAVLLACITAVALLTLRRRTRR